MRPVKGSGQKKSVRFEWVWVGILSWLVQGGMAGPTTPANDLPSAQTAERGPGAISAQTAEHGRAEIAKVEEEKSTSSQPAQDSQKPAGEQPPAKIFLGNEALSLQFDEMTGKLERIENKLAGRTLAGADKGFQIELEGQPALGPEDFTLQKADRRHLANAAQQIRFRYAGKKPGLALEIVYELGQKDFFVRRWLELESQTPLDLRRVEAWVVQVPGQCTHQGFGEPIFLEDTFWGLEFPAGHNLYEEGTVKLVHYPGRRVQGRWTSKTAVFGVAEPGRLLKRFRQYVASFQASPSELNLFVNYNTWWTLMPPTEQNCLQLIETFRKNLWEPFGESFDTFTIDDGWDEKNSLWEIQKERFPRGFGPLVEELKKMNGRLGLWLSPSSGYNHAPWGAKAGYEANSNPWYLCQSGPRYRRDIQEVVLRLARQYQLAFYKFDGFSATCDAQGHDHLPGEYAKEANVEAYIELLEAVRRERPGIFLDPTCGMWLSPWWLRYADSIWGSVSGDYPDIIVPAPIVRDSATTTRDAAFRQRCREHPGYLPSAIEHLGIIVISPEKWEDNAAIVVGRGCRLLTLYINPQFFTKGREDWAFLASLLRWARKNADVLAQTELILGDPFKREPYGYAHWRAGRGILALRNPFIEPRKVSIPLDETIGWESAPETPTAGSATAPQHATGSVRLAARIIYPRHETLPTLFAYGDRLELELSAYETVLMELVPARLGEAPGPTKPSGAIASGGQTGANPAASEPPLAGLSVRELRREARQIEYELFGQPGQKSSIRLPAGVQAAWLDGEPVALADPSGPVEIPFGGQEPLCKVENFSQRVVLGDGSEPAWKIEGNGRMRVGPGLKAALHLLFDPKTSPAGPVDCQVKLGDRPVEVRAVRSPEKPVQTHLPHRWTWFEAQLPEGEYQFTWTIRPITKADPAAGGKPAVTGLDKPGQTSPAKGKQAGANKPEQTAPTKPPYLVGEVGCWVWAEARLVRRVLRLEFQQGVMPPEPPPWPLPIQQDRSRQIITLQPAGSVRIGSRWTGLSQPVVHLDQAAPNQVEQSWGRLQRGRSVWEKPMTIAGKTFSSGLGAHAESRIVYDLAGGGFKKFRAYIGRDQHAMDGEVIFEVWLDGRKVFASGPMRKDSPAQLVEVDVEGAEQLELRALPGADGVDGDHANWADAQLLRE